MTSERDEDRHPLTDVWALCDRLDAAANAATRARPQVRRRTGNWGNNEGASDA